jgi:hypothetical protein
MDILDPVFAWSPTMARADNATVPGSRCRLGYRTFHCVSRVRCLYQAQIS